MAVARRAKTSPNNTRNVEISVWIPRFARIRCRVSSMRPIPQRTVAMLSKITTVNLTVWARIHGPMMARVTNTAASLGT